MQREVTSWHSPALCQPMSVAVYGHYGFALLLIPTADTGHLEYEQHGLIECIRPFIEAGKVKVYCLGSVLGEVPAPVTDGQRPRMYQRYYDYVFREVLPFIKNTTSEETPVLASGVAIGALHAANLFFKHPDLVQGVLAVSGTYDLCHYTHGYYDQDVYFNSPAHYLPNLNAEWHLSEFRQSRQIYLVSGSGAYENPASSWIISSLLAAKGVPHELDIWGEGYPHEWWAWHRMYYKYLEFRL
jgi:esterase/lipase superfamily enzyme